jgi:hypothetical protein
LSLFSTLPYYALAIDKGYQISCQNKRALYQFLEASCLVDFDEKQPGRALSSLQVSSD